MNRTFGFQLKDKPVLFSNTDHFVYELLLSFFPFSAFYHFQTFSLKFSFFYFDTKGKIVKKVERKKMDEKLVEGNFTLLSGESEKSSFGQIGYTCQFRGQIFGSVKVTNYRVIFSATKSEKNSYPDYVFYIPLNTCAKEGVEKVPFIVKSPQAIQPCKDNQEQLEWITESGSNFE